MVRTVRHRDPQTAENGFSLLRARAAEHVEELIAEFRAERDDHGLRCWLLELIGDARSPVALPLLSLPQLDTKQARQALWRARADGQLD